MDPLFIEIQMKWYGQLAQAGFVDIEDVANPERPLIKWSGVSHNHLVDSDRKNLPKWPENPFVMQEELLYHPELSMVCESICKHGNHTLSPIQVRKILEMHIQGTSCREIGKALEIGYVTVFRVEKKLKEWALIIEARSE
jgi:hypothetical protein